MVQRAQPPNFKISTSSHYVRKKIFFFSIQQLPIALMLILIRRAYLLIATKKIISFARRQLRVRALRHRMIQRTTVRFSRQFRSTCSCSTTHSHTMAKATSQAATQIRGPNSTWDVDVYKSVVKPISTTQIWLRINRERVDQPRLPQLAAVVLRWIRVLPRLRALSPTTTRLVASCSSPSGYYFFGFVSSKPIT